MKLVEGGVPIKFLSTPSVRRATRSCSPGWSAVSYFYPRPPRGGRLPNQGVQLRGSGISIHALREEGDRPHKTPGTRYWISIHALREEGDSTRTTSAPMLLHFYPRPP